MAEFLLHKGYEVHGLIRRSSTFNTQRIEHIYIDPHSPKAKLFLHYGDLSDQSSLNSLILKIKPNEIYNLGAQSHVRVSFDMPQYTGDVSALGVTRILEAVRASRIKAKFYQASSSEMFGQSAYSSQNEKTPFYPSSPYAIAKVYAYWMTVNYRESYDMFASNGILFNHESPRRGETFVTRKITKAIANILKGSQRKLYLGNLDAKRDWGFAPEYVEAMWLMLQQNAPEDYVIGTGQAHSVKEFVERAFNYAGIQIKWRGEGLAKKGIVKKISAIWRRNIKAGDILVEIDPRYFRPTEVCYLKADITKAKRELRWSPRVAFEELVKIMVDYDMKFAGLKPIGEGIKISKNKKFCYTLHEFSNHREESENIVK